MVSSPGGNTWVNTRPASDAINGTIVSNTTFDGFFGPSTSGNYFLVVGDSTGNLTGDNVGVSYADLMFTGTIPLGAKSVTVAYDWVFDTNNNPSNPDILTVSLRDATSEKALVQLVSVPVRNSSSFRGSFSLDFTGPSLASLAGADRIRFYLQEFASGSSSAVGIDNLKITAIPAPATLALFAGGLFGLGLSRRRDARTAFGTALPKG